MDRINKIRQSLNEQIEFFQEKFDNSLTDIDRHFYSVRIKTVQNLIKKLEEYS